MDKTILELVALYDSVRDVIIAFDDMRMKVSPDQWDDYCNNPLLDDLFTKLIALQEKIDIT